MASSSTSPPRPAVIERRIAHVPAFLVVSLVLLRLVVGYHFYHEGTKKLTYNPETGDVSVNNVAEPFLRLAVGPVAEIVREELPNVYNWEQYLAAPRQVRPSTEEELAARAKWESEYAARRKAAQTKKEPLPVEYPPDSPYYDWASRIDAGWRGALDKFKAISGLTDDQKTQAEQSLLFRRQQLADYLASERDAIAEWEHELWRLAQWEKEQQAGAADLPFLGARIEEKRTETRSASAAWIAEVRNIEHAYLTDLRELLTDEQVKNASLVEAVDEALVDPKQRQLDRMNVAVTAVIIGTGVCLMLGLLTRLAAMCGIGFLLTVLATQPPWVPGAQTMVLYYQLVEIAALFVLFASGAGRWAGLDFFFRALFRGRAGTES
jgi:uncharacterized membrane protein YphA (DoxX/SURF4 family)